MSGHPECSAVRVAGIGLAPRPCKSAPVVKHRGNRPTASPSVPSRQRKGKVSRNLRDDIGASELFSRPPTAPRARQKTAVVFQILGHLEKSANIDWSA